MRRGDFFWFLSQTDNSPQPTDFSQVVLKNLEVLRGTGMSSIDSIIIYRQVFELNSFKVDNKHWALCYATGYSGTDLLCRNVLTSTDIHYFFGGNSSCCIFVDREIIYFPWKKWSRVWYLRKNFSLTNAITFAFEVHQRFLLDAGVWTLEVDLEDDQALNNCKSSSRSIFAATMYR